MEKKITSLLGCAAVASSIILTPTTSMADDAIVTGNAGILSDYIFRGIFQDSGVGNGGLDIEYAGFYAGTWIADVGTGIEYDL
ncbi:MAG: TorF family putative porin, partial [Gammaproteobacteria bacterium]